MLMLTSLPILFLSQKALESYATYSLWSPKGAGMWPDQGRNGDQKHDWEMPLIASRKKCTELCVGQGRLPGKTLPLFVRFGVIVQPLESAAGHQLA